MAVITDIVDSILHGKAILNWDHNELYEFKKLGENVLVKIPGFDEMKLLRTLIKNIVRLFLLFTLFSKTVMQ